MRRLLLLTLLPLSFTSCFVVCGCSPPPLDPNVAGVWTGTLDRADGRAEPFTLTFDEHPTNALIGTFTASGTPPMTAPVTGDARTGELSVNAAAFRLTFKGGFLWNEYRGTFELEPASGPARREQGLVRTRRR